MSACSYLPTATLTTISAPLYQILNHALPDKKDKTKFKLIFSNISEKDILLKEELDTLKAKYPSKLDIVYVVDNGSESWTGAH